MLGAPMAERRRIMISVSDEDAALAEAQLEAERARRIVSQSMRLPAYLSLLLERQIHNPSPLGEPSDRASPARSRKR